MKLINVAAYHKSNMNILPAQVLAGTVLEELLQQGRQADFSYSGEL